MKKVLFLLSLLLAPVLLRAQPHIVSDHITATHPAKGVSFEPATAAFEPYGPVASNGVIVVHGKQAVLPGRFPEARIVVSGHGAYAVRELPVHTCKMLKNQTPE